MLAARSVLSYAIYSGLLATTLVLSMGSAKATPVLGQGTWETTLQPRYFTSDRADLPDAYYDTALNITWLAFAGGEGGSVDGVYFPEGTPRPIGFDSASGWRVPTVSGTEVCPDQYSDCYVNLDIEKSEFAHMYYITLGNKEGINGPNNALQPSTGLTNTGPFKSLSTHIYLTAWDEINSSHHGTVLWLNEYGQAAIPATGRWGSLHDVWTVHSGDVGSAAPVPEPGTYALSLTGLALAAASHLRKRFGFATKE